MFTRIGAGLIAASVLVASGCQTARYKAQAIANVSGAAVQRLDVESANGGIRVKLGSGPDIVVTARILAVSQERADSTTIITATSLDGGLTIEPGWPDGVRTSSESCAFTIEVPRSMPVSLLTGNGAIEVLNMKGDAVARTSNGRIEFVGHVGRIDAETSNGAVRIELAPTNPGPVRIQTSNGAVELAIGAGFAGVLDARTSNGSMSAAVPNARVTSGRRSIRVEMATAGEPSSITTSNGRVTIRSVD